MDRMSDSAFENKWNKEVALIDGLPVAINELAPELERDHSRAREAEKMWQSIDQGHIEWIDNYKDRIVELEKENAELKSKNDNIFHEGWLKGREDRVDECKALVRENAELKESVQDWKDTYQAERELVDSKNMKIEELKAAAVIHRNGLKETTSFYECPVCGSKNDNSHNQECQFHCKELNA